MDKLKIEKLTGGGYDYRVTYGTNAMGYLRVAYLTMNYTGGLLTGTNGYIVTHGDCWRISDRTIRRAIKQIRGTGV